MEQHCGIPVVGSIPRDPDLLIAERHLGLIPSLESSEAESLVERIANKLESYLDLERILSIARSSKAPQTPSLLWKKRKTKKSLLPPGRGIGMHKADGSGPDIRAKLGLSATAHLISITRKTLKLWKRRVLNSSLSIPSRIDCPSWMDFISEADFRSSF